MFSGNSFGVPDKNHTEEDYVSNPRSSSKYAEDQQSAYLYSDLDQMEDMVEGDILTENGGGDLDELI